VLFGQVWSRPGLELAARSMITIAALTALTGWS
jgi:alkylhydroperoxidase/carboxymuconolactone decarboxylase family protein YurZ